MTYVAMITGLINSNNTYTPVFAVVEVDEKVYNNRQLYMDEICHYYNDKECHIISLTASILADDTYSDAYGCCYAMRLNWNFQHDDFFFAQDYLKRLAKEYFNIKPTKLKKFQDNRMCR